MVIKVLVHSDPKMSDSKKVTFDVFKFKSQVAPELDELEDDPLWVDKSIKKKKKKKKTKKNLRNDPTKVVQSSIWKVPKNSHTVGVPSNIWSPQPNPTTNAVPEAKEKDQTVSNPSEPPEEID